MTKEEATKFFSELYYGEHHFPGNLKDWGNGWCMNSYEEFSTYDFNAMTRLVFMAHEYCYRASISFSGPKMIRIIIHKREGREGRMYQKHPTIETALKEWKEERKNDN